jgi:hypothetical protein
VTEMWQNPIYSDQRKRRLLILGFVGLPPVPLNLRRKPTVCSRQ